MSQPDRPAAALGILTARLRTVSITRKV